MKKTTLSLFAVLILTSKIQSQSFLNGSFENTTGVCEYNISDSSFNALMNDCYSYGNNFLDIIKSQCGYGSAKDGSFFVGIACNSFTPPAPETFSMALNTPLIIGQTYTLSLWNKKNIGYPTNRLKIGYSTDSLSFGILIDSILPPNTIWTNHSLSFSPINNSKFITVAVADTFFSWNLIDNFTLNNTTGINDMNEIEKALSLFPNPVYTLLNVTLDKANYITVFNLLGKTIMEKTFFKEEKIELDVSSFSSGIYFIKTGNEVRKFVKE